MSNPICTISFRTTRYSRQSIPDRRWSSISSSATWHRVTLKRMTTRTMSPALESPKCKVCRRCAPNATWSVKSSATCRSIKACYRQRGPMLRSIWHMAIWTICSKTWSSLSKSRILRRSSLWWRVVLLILGATWDPNLPLLAARSIRLILTRVYQVSEKTQKLSDSMSRDCRLTNRMASTRDRAHSLCRRQVRIWTTCRQSILPWKGEWMTLSYVHLSKLINQFSPFQLTNNLIKFLSRGFGVLGFWGRVMWSDG